MFFVVVVFHILIMVAILLIAVAVLAVPEVVFVDMTLEQPGLKQVVSKPRNVEGKARQKGPCM